MTTNDDDNGEKFLMMKKMSIESAAVFEFFSAQIEMSKWIVVRRMKLLRWKIFAGDLSGNLVINEVADETRANILLCVNKARLMFDASREKPFEKN